MNIVLALAYAAAMIAFDFLPYQKGAKKGENALYLTITALGLGLLLAHMLGVKVPSPAQPIKALIDALLGPVY